MSSDILYIIVIKLSCNYCGTSQCDYLDNYQIMIRYLVVISIVYVRIHITYTLINVHAGKSLNYIQKWRKDKYKISDFKDLLVLSRACTVVIRFNNNVFLSNIIYTQHVLFQCLLFHMHLYKKRCVECY